MTTFTEKERKYLIEKNKSNMKLFPVVKASEQGGHNFVYSPETIFENQKITADKCIKKKK